MRDLQYWEAQIRMREKALDVLSEKADKHVTQTALLMADVQNVIRDTRRGLDDERMELEAEKRDAGEREDCPQCNGSGIDGMDTHTLLPQDCDLCNGRGKL